MPEALYLTESDEANRLIASDPLALLIGFALDQQVTVPTAFAGPQKLKERVGDLEEFIDAVTRVAAGGSALDPEVVARMLGRRRVEGPVDRLTPRERDVLASMAEGKSNQGIAEALVVTEAAIEKHVTSIFQKLGLGPMPLEHRRVHAVLTYLRDSAS